MSRFLSAGAFVRLGVAALLAGASLAAGAGAEVDPDALPGYDVRWAEQRIGLQERLSTHVIRLEAVSRPKPPFDPSQTRTEDGAGTAVAPGRLVTTGRWLVDAEQVRGVRRDGSFFPVRVLTVDPVADLALVSFDPADVPGLKPVPAVGPVPPENPASGAALVFVPTSLLGDVTGLRDAAARVDDDGVLLLSGVAYNGVPAFDARTRLVALAQRPTPERARTVAVPGERIAEWLREATAGADSAPEPQEKRPPRAETRGGQGP